MVGDKGADSGSVVAEIKSLVGQGNYERARAICHELCTNSPRDAGPWLMLGAIYGQQNEITRSEECTRKALAIDPNLYSAHYNLALLLAGQHRLKEAEYCFHQALRLRPADAVIYHQLGNVLGIMDKTGEAVAAYRKAIQLQPRFRDALFDLGNLLVASNDLHGALGCVRSAFACDPGFIKAKAVEASILELQGDIQGAYACLKPWADRERVEPIFAEAFAAVSTHIGKEHEAIDCLINTIEAHRHEQAKIALLYFRLGALLERVQRFDDAFANYRKGNELSDLPDNSAGFIQGLKKAREMFPGYVMTPGPGALSDGGQLIFILGMPRSGTSLVEQILATHTRVLAAGERPWLSRLSQEVYSELRTEDGNIDMAGLTADSAERYASRYLNTTQANIGIAERITEKTPHNFQHIGLISMLFPKAHVIHCIRDPLDTCISCYSTNFSGENLAYSRDLSSLGQVYKEYASLMQYWKKKAAVPILDVSYELLVKDTEQIARGIIEFCGLEWQEQCLQFYSKGRQVHTASYNQVRQPIYKKAIGRWRHFDKQLEPLKKALGVCAYSGGE